MRTVDVTIVGGGIIGAAIAYHLLERRPRLRVLVLEREATLGIGSTAYATGGIRHQFSSAIHVRLTQFAYPQWVEFARVHQQDIQFRTNGYLFLTGDAATWATSRTSAALQRGLGVPVLELAPEEVRDVVPFLRTDDLVGATY